MDIYDRIAFQLKSQRLTRKSLCNETGIPYATLSSLFQRRSENINMSTIIKVADFLGVTTDYLIIGDRLKAGYSLSEDPDHTYQNGDTITRELLRIINKLTVKGKNALLSRAYELEETDSKE